MVKIVREEEYLALSARGKTLILRNRVGMVTPGCENLVTQIETMKPLNFEGVPDAIAKAAKSLVVPPDGVCDSR